jgi:SNF2 family DNA or RNA helicase
MNGYAESLFSNLWALSPAFREEFKRDERKTYTDRYGYRKKLVEDRDKQTKEVVTFGSHSDRTERTERILGDAPGVLPVVVLRHLLPIAVTLHKDDLALDLPPCHESRESIEPAGTLGQHYRHLQSKLVDCIKRDQFGPLAGKLFGALLELPAYLDRASEDVGNGQPGVYQISYPESAGGGVVAEVPLLPAGDMLPKEEWLLDTVARELAEGRRCMVFVWNVNLLPRLARLLEARLGEKVATLVPERVPTQKRQAWIDREVVAKKVRVMLVNSVTVQTGLNNLVWFATEVWYQNPACNPVVYRQAVGRVDRIGQTLPTRILFPVYLGTAQEQAHKLLMTKVGLSMALDGLDGEAALMAAGGGEWSAMAGLSVAKQLFDLVEKLATTQPAPKSAAAAQATAPVTRKAAPRVARPAKPLPPVGVTLGMDFGD